MNMRRRAALRCKIYTRIAIRACVWRTAVPWKFNSANCRSTCPVRYLTPSPRRLCASHRKLNVSTKIKKSQNSQFITVLVFLHKWTANIGTFSLTFVEIFNWQNDRCKVKGIGCAECLLDWMHSLTYLRPSNLFIIQIKIRGTDGLIFWRILKPASD